MNSNNEINEMKIIDNRIELFIDKFVKEYPISYITNIMDEVISELNNNNYIIHLCIKVWNLSPSSMLTFDELIDASILAQLSYNTYLLFLSLPDMCDYSGSWISKYKLNQIQLGIIWLSSFILQETSEMVYKWQIKDISKKDKQLLQDIGVHYKNRMIGKHKMLKYDKLSNQLVERRKQIAEKLKVLDNEFYVELLVFFNSVCITKSISIPTYQKHILDDLDLDSYYIKQHPTMVGKKIKHKQKLDSNKILTEQLLAKYQEMYNIHNIKRNIGIPFK